jgi:hypothetical protein
MGYFASDRKCFYMNNAENNVMNKIVSENMKVASKILVDKLNSSSLEL